MRISSNYFRTLYNTSTIRQNQAGASDASKNNYDEIMIRSTSPEAMDSKFASAVKGAITREISQPASEEKLDLLKQKIANGTYQVDSNQIAERILSYKGADMDV